MPRTLVPSLALLSLACGAREPTSAEPHPVAVTPVVVGCAALKGDVCTRPLPGPATHCEPTREPPEAIDDEDAFALTVWLPGGRPGDSLRVDEGAPPVRSIAFDDGIRLDVVVPADARGVMLVRDSRTLARWRIVAPDPEADTVARARSARTLPPRDPGRRRHVEDLRASLPGLSDRDRATALDIVADLELQRAGAVDTAERTAAWRDALSATEAAHAHALARDDQARARCHARRGLFVSLERLGDPAEIERWRTRLAPRADERSDRPAPPGDAYYRGLLAQRIGDLQGAAAELRTAEHGAARLGDALLATAAAQQLAAVLASLGREQEVAEGLRRAEQAAAELDCRAWLRLLNNAAWSRVLLGDLGRPSEDPIPDLANALAILDGADASEDACHDDVLGEHVRLNLALAAASAGWIGYAEDLRARLPAEPFAAIGTASWRAELDRRLALATGDRGALVEWLASHRVPPSAMTPEQAWWWAWGRGEVLEALGAPDDALAEYDAAEGVLTAMLRDLDFDAGRDRLLLAHQRSAGRRVELLAARGESKRALCAARLARGRTSRALDRSARIAALSPTARREFTRAIAEYEQVRRELDALEAETWSVPLDERGAHEAEIAATRRTLRSRAGHAADLLAEVAEHDDEEACARLPWPEQGELGLLYFPTQEAWIGFAFDEHGEVTSARAPALAGGDDDLSAWARHLLEPFRPRIAAARSLRILPTGASWTVPFGAVPWDDDVLLAAKPIALGLDLASAGQAMHASDGAHGDLALVVADPSGDLPAALHEADAVGAMLEAHGWSVQQLRRDGARAWTLRARLPRADLLHYAGHGTHAGLEGWQSALELASGERLEVTDVLALSSVPRQVVLPACDTAPGGAATLGGDMNIARAFLLAGADVVIGAQREVDDAFAARVAVALYRDEAPAVATASVRLQRALLEARADASLPPEVREQWSRIVAIVR